MTIKYVSPRSLLVAGALAFAGVPLMAGTAYAGTAPQPQPQPTATATHAPAPRPRVTVLATRVAGVHIRSAAKVGKRSRILVSLPAAGTKVAVRCYKTGPGVGGDTTWYRTVSPRAGFVAGRELAVAKEPAAGVPTCRPKK
jgi:hypothetical protein